MISENSIEGKILHNQCKDLLITDYYLYFLIICLPSSRIVSNNFCKIHKTFVQFVPTGEFVLDRDYITFEFDFGDSTSSIGDYLAWLAPQDIADAAMKFVKSISEHHGIRIKCLKGLEDMWLALSMKTKSPIKFKDNTILFV